MKHDGEVSRREERTLPIAFFRHDLCYYTRVAARLMADRPDFRRRNYVFLEWKAAVNDGYNCLANWLTDPLNLAGRTIIIRRLYLILITSRDVRIIGAIYSRVHSSTMSRFVAKQLTWKLKFSENPGASVRSTIQNRTWKTQIFHKYLVAREVCEI